MCVCAVEAPQRRTGAEARGEWELCLEASRSSRRRMCSEKSSPFSRASRCAAVSCCGCRAITATLRDRPLIGAGLALGLAVRLGDADVRPCGPIIDARLLSLFELITEILPLTG